MFGRKSLFGRKSDNSAHTSEGKEPEDSGEEETSGSEDDDDGKVESKKSSKFFRVKKYLAVKAVGSGPGKKVVIHYLGKPGESLLQCLEAVATADVGKKKTKDLIRKLFRIACKAKLLHDEQILNVGADAKKYFDAINSIAFLAHSLLKRGSEKVSITNLALKVAQLEQLFLDLFRDYVTPNTLATISELMGYFGSTLFLDLLINDNRYAANREQFFRALEEIMKHHWDEKALLGNVAVICKEKGCNEEVQYGTGSFVGSQYCSDHHRIQYTALLTSPSIMHFLVENGKGFPPFEEFKRTLPQSASQVLIATHNFYSIRPSVRRVFVEEVFRKYLCPTSQLAVNFLPDAVIQSAKDLIAAANAPRDDGKPFYVIEDNALEVVMTAVLKEVMPLFIKGFVWSENFELYLESRQPPEISDEEAQRMRQTGNQQMKTMLDPPIASNST